VQRRSGDKRDIVTFYTHAGHLRNWFSFLQVSKSWCKDALSGKQLSEFKDMDGEDVLCTHEVPTECDPNTDEGRRGLTLESEIIYMYMCVCVCACVCVWNE
jgi:hypothetical protein